MNLNLLNIEFYIAIILIIRINCSNHSYIQSLSDLIHIYMHYVVIYTAFTFICPFFLTYLIVFRHVCLTVLSVQVFVLMYIHLPLKNNFLSVIVTF